MTESFLHFLWAFQQFDKSHLQSTTNQGIKVFKTGALNTDAGPDFLNARLLIDEVEWAGSVEIHIKSSDWNLHQHQSDKAYSNVILHVVWENNESICRADGTTIPTLELKGITDQQIVEKYSQLTDNQFIIPCNAHFRDVSQLSKFGILDKALTQRLRSKALVVYELLKQNSDDWEETAYQLLAKNFGFKLNSEAFLRLAQNLPLKTLQKHRGNLLQIEAMIFGVSGLLDSDFVADSYTDFLKKEFDFFATKFDLKLKQLNAHEWKFLRLRPANFPTIRLAQFSKLIESQKSFFSLFTQTDSFEDLMKLLRVEQSTYWQNHYVLGKEANQQIAALGKSSAENIIINTVIPLLACYSQLTDNQVFMDRAMSFLEKLPAEKNHITSTWEDLGLPIKNAFDSQASIELYNNYCQQKKCLNCAIGIEIMKQ